MSLYLVTTDRPTVPATRVAADDLFELGEQVASYLARHRLIRRGVTYDAQISDEFGVITQPGLPKPVTFSIKKEA